MFHVERITPRVKVRLMEPSRSTPYWSVWVYYMPPGCHREKWRHVYQGKAPGAWGKDRVIAAVERHLAQLLQGALPCKEELPF